MFFSSKYPKLSACLLIVVLLLSCGGKKNPNAEESAYEDWEEQEEELADSTIFGLCLDGSAMHSLQLLTDSGDTLFIDVLPAQEKGTVFGGYDVGDRMAVLLTRKRDQATIVINLNALLGDWVMQNPFDGSSEMGICIKDGGIAESINQNSLSYQTWRIVNGQLELNGIREGSGDFEESDVYRIQRLTADSLIIGNEDETFEYARPGKPEDYGDIELEEDYNDLTF